MAPSTKWRNVEVVIFLFIQGWDEGCQLRRSLKSLEGKKQQPYEAIRFWTHCFCGVREPSQIYVL